jgi:hypothetical protein
MKVNVAGDHRVEQDKPSSERQTSHVFTRMQNLDINKKQ